MMIERFQRRGIPLLTGVLVFGGILAGWMAPANKVRSEDYRIETLEEAPPADDLSAEVAETLSETGLRVVEGERRTICEIWLCRNWEVDEAFEKSSEHLYPFQQGQLIGIIRFRRTSYDFRDQEIERGVYTLRYALQPVDGNHVGTSPTRDFLLLVRAEEDSSAEPYDVETLEEMSAEAVFSNHPAMLCLQPPDEELESPEMRPHDRYEWMIANFAGHSEIGLETRKIPIALVVVGFAEE